MKNQHQKLYDVKRDLSIQLYEKYFTLKNSSVEITLKNKLVIKGTLIGYFKSDADSGKPFISRWRLIDEKDNETSLGIDIFGYATGKIVNQNDILEVWFHDDNSVMKFYEDVKICSELRTKFDPLNIFKQIQGSH